MRGALRPAGGEAAALGRRVTGRLGAIPGPAGRRRSVSGRRRARVSRCGSGARRTTARARGDGPSRGRSARPPGDDYVVRPRRRPGAARTRARASSPRGSAGRRAWSRSHPPPGAGSRSTTLVIYELHVGPFSEEGTFDAVIPHLARAARARRDGDRADAGRHLPGGARLGLRRRLPVRAAPRLRRARGPGPARRRRAPRGARRDHGRRPQPHRARHRGGDRLRAVPDRPRSRPSGATGVDFSHAGVREWAIQNALQWVDDYGIDGLRLDAIRAIRDDSARHVLAELAEPRARARAARARHLRDERRRRPADRGVGARRAVGGRPPPCAARPPDRRARGVLRALRLGCGRGAASSSAGRRSATSSARRTTTRSGNRALGDRLPPELLRVASAVVLFSAQTPLLFMGEEYGEPNPFQFFCDHIDPAIAEATRQGRKREFAAVLGVRRRRARSAGPGDVPALEALPPRDAGHARPLPQAALPAA